MNSPHQSKRLIVLVGSPRRDGNSATLAQAIMAGAAEAGTDASLFFLDDYINAFLVDERHAIPPADRYGELFLEHFLPADAAVFCTPLYWYGMSAQTKAFFDRSFSYYSSAYPDAEQVHQRMSGKRIGLAVASEETYPGAAMGIVHQIQEFSRYSHSEFVGLVHGAGNSRGEISRDPRNPLQAARELGREIFTRPYSDYRMDTPRSPQVWQN
ncbi:flavodoxin family protein [Serratia liquefaciens]|uniref:Flavodoxin family protein n=1 Tax=Serratia liquefaciens TaxID=614 RepID=A0A515CT42_SERLI|nr:flavodoxin family protein [Serratia liquefaciens]MDU5486239.1 flavodoxin family protein [Serratia liquefaciens]QDL31342.1 flavodoxin family protein [Serratia liquefaciens]CAI0937706.1 Putative NAD(P)H-dependent FMN-containing oxidoreductase ywqN [Serratia liquefaciens]CAI0957693.1 Putative NAD(P)H-dependent FMN-containing oxidoreductase ywqN [Serratia liquefaciens]HED2334517.1 flavodoxin family protein [Serratia liquefaciens]